MDLAGREQAGPQQTMIGHEDVAGKASVAAEAADGHAGIEIGSGAERADDGRDGHAAIAAAATDRLCPDGMGFDAIGRNRAGVVDRHLAAVGANAAEAADAARGACRPVSGNHAGDRHAAIAAAAADRLGKNAFAIRRQLLGCTIIATLQPPVPAATALAADRGGDLVAALAEVERRRHAKPAGAARRRRSTAPAR